MPLAAKVALCPAGIARGALFALFSKNNFINSLYVNFPARLDRMYGFDRFS